jgi:hypothetical protein
MIHRVSIVLLALALVGCEHKKPPPDPGASARAILEDCRDDWACVHERWRRDPRNWNLGLRAEVAWKKAETPAIVATTREIVSTEVAGSPCAPSSAEAPVYFRTDVSLHKSGESPFAAFAWPSIHDAEAGQRAVRTAVAAARGDESKLWSAVEAAPDLDRACVRFSGRRDRCASAEG